LKNRSKKLLNIIYGHINAGNTRIKSHKNISEVDGFLSVLYVEIKGKK
jgi:hypothetical protein